MALFVMSFIITVLRNGLQVQLDNYPSGQAVVQRLEKLPYTKMERDLAMESGLVTEAQIQEFWEV